MDCMVPEMSSNKTAKTYMKLLRYERESCIQTKSSSDCIYLKLISCPLTFEHYLFSAGNGWKKNGTARAGGNCFSEH